MTNKTTYNFDEYIQQGEPDKRQRAENWQIAIGLQAVDGLKPSQYLIETAQKHIEGELDIETVKRRIDEYYKTEEGRKLTDDGTDEADKVSANITDLLAEDAFTLAPHELAHIHRRLFTGVLKHAGEYRTYNISKREWVLDGDSVAYAPYELLRETIEFDFAQEKLYSFKDKDSREVITHICKFISGLWELHPFGEGNTRTTAVFTIRYLKKLGFKTTNEAFKQHSWYFRNALVRANYNNTPKGISSTTVFLERFFENLLLGENHELRNRFCHIYWKEESSQSTQQVPDKYRTSSGQAQDKYRTSIEQASNKLRPSTEQVAQLIRAIGNDELTVKEMLARLQLKGRDNFLNLYLSPAISGGWVRMLYPNSPRHPRQKYLLTVKGLAYYND